ncbi:MAG: hypothetical protein ACTSXA_10740 [Candidatus Heimdallarchaeota archaeon]
MKTIIRLKMVPSCVSYTAEILSVRNRVTFSEWEANPGKGMELRYETSYMVNNNGKNAYKTKR